MLNKKIFRCFVPIILIINFAWPVHCTERFKKPTVLIATLIRNKAHTLPYFLSLLEQQNYPKDRLSLWIRSDNNIDNSSEVLKTWLAAESNKYHDVNIYIHEESKGFEDENSITDWSSLRFAHVMNLRQEALDYARKIWADFIWIIDADVFLTNPNTLTNLVSKEHTVVAPLLRSDGLYSNFWAGMTDDYYYLRTESYQPILYRETVGCFNVPMIHGAVLMNLKMIESDRLTYNPTKLAQYDGPLDDVIVFAVGANSSGVSLHVCNDELYGYIMVPLEKDETIKEDLQRLTNIKLEILSEEDYLPLSSSMEKFVSPPKVDTLGLDKIYMINLLRRPERRTRMHRLFKELGAHVETINAVDGRMLNESTLEKWGVKLMAEYADPYHKRPMTTGEIGCFLSHYVIWNKMLEYRYEHIMILEDDIRFEPFFRQKLDFILSELSTLKTQWDLIYIGRKRLLEKEEPWVQGSKYVVHAAYSYWTLGYILSATGAKKLVEAKPLENLIPVDEYIPILSNAHPRNDWKMHYSVRNLIVLSTNPLLIHPTHYTGDDGYISDTENSKIIVNNETSNIMQNREEL
ncbi:hypothetical protein KPH14_012134 [Odynerus spinipes]|uniref:Glycosyl transferase family 25 domain-containing protein n=1 Tax=Odynerus spinipes TaxID=1348599 RepID=A0AAD9VM07_9HYME|nr:hypothetical protein KPH14_012134 [Odynerus spinipes]